MSTHPPVSDRRANVREGIATGLAYAVGFMALAALSLAMATLTGRAPATAAASTWFMAAAFYLVAGVLGGAVYGLLRPLRERYLGRLLTAYLILFLVYGGGTAALWPLVRQDAGRVTLPVMFGFWSILALILAPLYVWVLRR